MEIERGYLVRTPDGYYGLVWSVEDREVFLGNGCMAVLPPEEWERLVAMPINIFNAGCAKASFHEMLDDPNRYRKATVVHSVDWIDP